MAGQPGEITVALRVAQVDPSQALQLGSIEAGASIRVSLHDWCRARGFDEVVGIESQKIMDEVEAKV